MLQRVLFQRGDCWQRLPRRKNNPMLQKGRPRETRTRVSIFLVSTSPRPSTGVTVTRLVRVSCFMPRRVREQADAAERAAKAEAGNGDDSASDDGSGRSSSGSSSDSSKSQVKRQGAEQKITSNPPSPEPTESKVDADDSSLSSGEADELNNLLDCQDKGEDVDVRPGLVPFVSCYLPYCIHSMSMSKFPMVGCSMRLPFEHFFLSSHQVVRYFMARRAFIFEYLGKYVFN